MNQKNTILLLPLTMMMLGLTACAVTPEPVGLEVEPVIQSAPDELVAAQSFSVINYTVVRGDSLGRIAADLTGDSGNWREIANFNNISNPRALPVGAVLEIPSNLIPGHQAQQNPLYTEDTISGDTYASETHTIDTYASETYNNDVVEPTSLIIATQAEQAAAAPLTTTLAVRKSQAAIAPVVVTPVYTNRDFELNPIEPGTDSNQPSRTASGTGTQIKVVGSYYPKGIYTEPAAYSRLIMRVAPGTIFPLNSQINDWYKIDTSSGVGYIRSNDAAIIE